MEIKFGKLVLRLDNEAKGITAITIDGRCITHSSAAMPLFSMRLLEENGTFFKISAADAQTTEIVQSSDVIEITYKDIQQTDLDITVVIRNQDGISFSLRLKNRTKYLVEWIDFPQIIVPNDLVGNGGKSRILWPFNEGTEISDICARDDLWHSYIEPEYPSRGLAGLFPGAVESQFVAYYDDRGGIYLGAHDNQGNLKCIEVFQKDGGIKLQFRLYPGIGFGESYCMDYDMILLPFDGDWHDAADIYRQWFDVCAPKDFVKIGENPNLPDWYHEMPVIVTYPVRGRHDADVMAPNQLFPYLNVMPHIEKLEQALGGKIMVLLMHWEGSAPWSPPYVWPPYGGEEALQKLICALHEKGHLLGVYCSGLGWTQHSGTTFYDQEAQYKEQNLWRHMCASPKGEVLESTICRGLRYGHDLCPEQSFTIDTLNHEVDCMTKAGIDYIQILDQNHGGLSTFCYSKIHGHPPAPGSWQIRAMKKLIEGFRTVAEHHGKKVLFGCESAAGESFIPNLLLSDNRFNLNYFMGRPVPLYAYLYHEYVNNFMGNQVCGHFAWDHDSTPDNIYYRMAYAFSAGDMLTLVIDENGSPTWNWGDSSSKTLPPQEETIQFAARLHAMQRRFPEFLHTGRMQKPYGVQSDTTIFRLRTGRELADQTVMVSAWRAQNGKEALFAVNYTSRPAEAVISLDGRCATLYMETEQRPIIGSETIHMPPLSVLAIVFD